MASSSWQIIYSYVRLNMLWNSHSTFCIYLLQSSDDKFVKLSDLEKIQSKQQQQQQGLNSASQEQSETLSAVPFEVLTAPDWLSLHEEDWTFFGPSARHVRVQTWREARTHADMRERAVGVHDGFKSKRRSMSFYPSLLGDPRPAFQRSMCHCCIYTLSCFSSMALFPVLLEQGQGLEWGLNT